jgi:hypothetical protein
MGLLPVSLGTPWRPRHVLLGYTALGALLVPSLHLKRP